MSFMFHKTHEQSYVAHATSFALCIGPYVKHPSCIKKRQPISSGSSSIRRNFNFATLATFLIMMLPRYMIDRSL